MQIWCRCLLYVETVTSSRKYCLINAIPLFGGQLPHRMRNLLWLLQIGIIDPRFFAAACETHFNKFAFYKEF